MKSTKSLIAASALAAALGSPLSHAAIGDVYSALFQGVTFTFTQTDADTLKFELAGNPPLGVDWVTATFLGAFDLKDIGLDFGTATGTAFGPGTPGFVDAGTPGTGLLGLNSQLSAASPAPETGKNFRLTPPLAFASVALCLVRSKTNSPSPPQRSVQGGARKANSYQLISRQT